MKKNEIVETKYFTFARPPRELPLAGCPTITRKSNDNNVILLYVADNSNSYR